jgi:hypothetical protein
MHLTHNQKDTYKIGDLAAWAGRPDVQQAFPDIRTTVNGISQANQIVGLQLPDRGWEVPWRSQCELRLI